MPTYSHNWITIGVLYNVIVSAVETGALACVGVRWRAVGVRMISGVIFDVEINASGLKLLEKVPIEFEKCHEAQYLL